MRKELSNIERIERYLQNLMQGEERRSFETEMSTSFSLREEVLLQKEAVELVNLQAWKMQAGKAMQRYAFMKNLKRWGGLGFVLAAIALGAVYYPSPLQEKMSAPSTSQKTMPAADNKGASIRSITALPEGSICNAGQKKIADSFTMKFRTFKVSPKRDTILALNSKGTRLYIQKNNFVDANGKTITAPVEISFREYTNSADIAFSQIPMVYHENGQEYMFNSAGMFEIQGKSNGQPVKIAPGKPMRIDYRMARVIPNTNFYALDKNREWKLLKKNLSANAANQLCDSTSQDTTILVSENDNGFATTMEVRQVMDKDELEEKESRLMAREDSKDNVADPLPPVIANNHKQENLVRNNAAKNNNQPNNVNKDINNGQIIIPKNAGTLITIPGDPGHTYPNVVRGLNVGDFGVYNCDQVYRIANLVSIRPVFADDTGRPISDPWIVAMIDLDYNGAFSFDPRYLISCNPKGKVVLLLFTKSGDMYVLNHDKFREMKIEKSGSYTFKMQNCTKTIKTTNDLSEYLGLVK